ncbi:N-acetylneuraminate epimerase [Edwardsiella piscicida]|uniref:N-acetylneuraminate epimerase n=1 Tax=Edwardsiella piscicida TaxID=1263550 RepID=UPI000D51347C|nr:N-acetylneuraminate epimerase [Edwardsiella piscicida]EKS7778707.1 N-acetylneuraminate epimerase [Edwardsiella piscicida]UCQ25297.1 N-acetylneuraminate epimerase [Edwardsiella piscicida]UCQ45345.1 N-acetylneuraminate epimerase [Edwardsiella piscicida]UJT79845.1 N-acetylneuraminate epimerase [Edwardsiella piscicida]
MSGLTQPVVRLLAAVILSASIIPAGNAEILPVLPTPFKGGTGAILNNTIYIGLGSADKSWYRLDLSAQEKRWEPIATFPGTARDQAVTLALNNSLYVFGGSGKATEHDGTPSALTDTYRYIPQNNQWQKIDAHPPRGFVGHAAVALNRTQGLFLGGVNKQIFDGYFRDLHQNKDDKQASDHIIQRYFDKPSDDYFFSREALLFDADGQRWQSLGVTPFAGTAGSALVRSGERITLINGEIKPGLRTDRIHYATWSHDRLRWTGEGALPPPPGEPIQEGLAGAYAGYSHGTLLVAGGANFPGARANYRQRHYYAHQGLNKHWQQAIYAQRGERWQAIGELPVPLGYGVSVSDGQHLYLIGGETLQGKAVDSVITLSMRDGKLLIER